MADIGWLATQAHQIHNVFQSMFYALVTTFLCIGIFVEYFKWPLGGMPSFSVLVGRVLVAAILLSTYPEVTNTLAEVTDAVSQRLGDLNQFKLVLSTMSDHLSTFTWSWVSVRDSVTMLLSFLTFFLLYFSVHVVEAFLMYTWCLLYVFSPLLIALFVLPATAGATKSLYRSLFEVSCWKIVWSVLATLVWSSALSDINQPGHDINFVTAICFNLILAGTLLLTPAVVHALAGAGMSSLMQTIGGVAVGATMLTPKRAASMASGAVMSGVGRAEQVKNHFSPDKSRRNSKSKEKASPDPHDYSFTEQGDC